MSDIEKIVGKTVLHVDVADDEVVFECSDGSRFKMWHDQDCCEGVSIEDVVGDWDNLVGVPILKAEETTNCDNPKKGDENESFT